MCASSGVHKAQKRVSDTLQYLSLCDCVTVLSSYMIFSRFTNIVANDKISYVFEVVWYSIKYKEYNIFIHLSVEGYWSWWYTLENVNSGVNNEPKPSPRHMHPTALGYISNNGITAPWILLLTVLGVSLFPIMAVLTYILTNEMSISFSPTSASTWYSWSETVHWAFDLHVPDNSWCWPSHISSHIFTSHLCFLWRKCVLRSLKNFNNSCLKIHFSVLGIQEL